ncbi:DUF1932 domain-containing protein [Rahnella ecdela]|uniref:NAD(P)-dependent oxidoreductase n=1 Tax=Rahnella ecdela TaxID=2816250 RepID=A0ABS6L9F9_9GAMM|nr:NAD(P)-dependent oxidoreductase [Rahnella ecdela]MBU9843564.1 NAD(P)-dependent oxidoreductase [Rahnella ecdela]
MKLVFIGFGEAAFNFSIALRSVSQMEIGAFDSSSGVGDVGVAIRERAEKAGVTLLDSLDHVCQKARFIVCLTSASSALNIAEKVIPNLHEGQIYTDMNSAAPAIKQQIDLIPRRNGVLFCDAAVMGTVPGDALRVPILLAGEGAKSFKNTFISEGMNLTDIEAEAGAASAIKMLKSIVMKGIPQLFLEAFIAAEKYGVLDTLVSSLSDSLDGKNIEQLAKVFTARTLIHAKRRCAEITDVIATLDALSVDASMSIATRNKLETLSQTDWARVLGPNGADMDYRSAINCLSNLARNNHE